MNLPNIFYIEPTNYCNLRCTFCPNQQIHSHRPLGYMHMEVFEHIIEQIPIGSYIHLYYSGEPFLNPQLPDMIKLCSDKGLITKVVTNGTIMNLRMCWRIFNSGLNTLSFSLDAANGTDYRKIKGGDFHSVIKNIELFVKTRARHYDSNHITVMATMVKTDDNKHKVDDFEKLCNNIGIDVCKIKTFLSWGNLVEQLDSSSPSLSKDGNYCEEPFRKMIILWNGDVIPCCADAKAILTCGNIEKNNLEDIWKGKLFTKLRKCFSDKEYYNDMPRICKNCCDHDRIKEPFHE